MVQDRYIYNNKLTGSCTRPIELCHTWNSGYCVPHV